MGTLWTGASARFRWVAAAAAAGAMASGAWTTAATAAPGSPQAPVAIYTEDFEHGVSNTAVGLESYTGAAPLSMTYDAHPSWLNHAVCNGIIASRATPASNGTLGCPTSIYSFWVNGLAEGMGNYHGAGPNDHVLVHTNTHPSFNAPTPAPALQTKAPIPLPGGGRFISFSVDVVVKCSAAAPRLRFYLLDGQDAIPAFGAGGPIDACATPGVKTAPTTTGLGTVHVGTFAANRGVLFSGATAGLKLTNDTSTGAGNDHAVDNIRMLDATPSLHKAFSPARINPKGQTGTTTSTLTFTVTNTSELGEKAGWSFSDDLPAGVTVAGDAATTCPATTVSAAAGQVQVSGALAAGQASCTVSVPVEAGAPGTYVNGPDRVSTTGLDAPEEAVLTVNEPPTVDIDGPADGEDYYVGQDVRADYSCADADGTVTSCSGPVADGEPVDTSTPGDRQLTVTATDNDGATATKTVTYRVRPVVGLCRGTPLSALGLDPISANRAESPCRAEHKQLLRVNGRIGGEPSSGLLGTALEPLASTVSADVVEGVTTAGLASARGESHVADATVRALGLVIRVQGVHARAASRLTTSCRAAEAGGTSSVATLTINGVERTDLDGPVSVPLPGLGGVHLNQQVREGNTVTQRAVFVDLPGTDLDVAIGEAKAGVACG